MPNFLPKCEGHFASLCDCLCTPATKTLYKPQSRPKMTKHLIPVLFFSFSYPDNEINLIRVHLTTKSQPGDQKTRAHHSPTQTPSGFLFSQHLFSATQTHQCLCSCTRHCNTQKKNAIKKPKTGIALNFFQFEDP